ncbi:ABC transporter ATP-binding protein [Candidatus Bathyarchaeota archaeon]|nr:ABC transporter ATP-binding protein [Candidatus Bathyarchaeota archaeon]RLI20857.1 MAG: ABC transporter ATP-binding protein [Candidatus Bathyarchaeota archaeon]
MKLRTVDLTRVYRRGSSDIVAVNKVNLTVEPAEFVAVVGPSGSGKTTLLNLIGLNDYPTSGKVFIDGSDASVLSGGERRKVRLFRMGFVFQTFNLLPTLSALENVELPMALAGVAQREQREKAVRLLEIVGLGNRLFHRPKELSMGEMQRVAIARALANDPELIIADEPTGELDSKTAREIVSLLSEINKERKASVVVATHDEKIVDVAQRVYRMVDGVLSLER